MNYLIDTCVISELVKSTPAQSVVKWLENIDEHKLHLSVLTLGELQKGVAKLPGSIRKQQLQHWIDNDVRVRFRARLLSITADVALVWGEIQGNAEKNGRKMPVIDSLIAATAIVNNLTVATRNRPDIARSNANVFDPWE